MDACLDCPVSISEGLPRKLAYSSHPIASDGTESLHSECTQWHLRETWAVLLSHFCSLPGWMHALEVCGLSQDIRLPSSKTTLLQQATTVWQEGEGCSVSAAFHRDLFCKLHAAGNMLSLSWAHVRAHKHIPSWSNFSDVKVHRHACLHMHKYFVVFVHKYGQKFSYLCTQSHSWQPQPPARVAVHVNATNTHAPSLSQGCMWGRKHIYAPCKEVAEFGGRDE